MSEEEKTSEFCSEQKCCLFDTVYFPISLDIAVSRNTSFVAVSILTSGDPDVQRKDGTNGEETGQSTVEQLLYASLLQFPSSDKISFSDN